MYNQGDILLVPVPFTDLSSQKKRPVLVLSNNLYNKIADDILVAAVTSNIAGKSFEISLNSDNMQDGILKINSCVRVDKIYTLSQSIVIKKFGSVKKQILEHVKEKILKLIS